MKKLPGPRSKLVVDVPHPGRTCNLLGAYAHACFDDGFGELEDQCRDFVRERSFDQDVWENMALAGFTVSIKFKNSDPRRTVNVA